MHVSDKGVLIVIAGPTGSGKTDLAIKLAQKLSTVIISADSRQVYRELKTGTAAPTEEQQSKVPHFFTGHKSIHDHYNAGIFENEALTLLKELFPQYGKIIMAGGSGLYIDAVCSGIDDLPAADTLLRKELERNYSEQGISYLRNKLKLLDPEHYRVVDLRNPKRMLKAIEVSLITGKSYSSLLTGRNKKRDFRIIKAGISLNREELYERINRRVDRMIEDGLVEEVQRYYEFRNLNALNTVGYKELFSYIDGEISLEKAIELIKRNTRHYARRQLTWFRRDKDIKWFSPDEPDEIISYIVKKAD